jgi:CRISPR system Cascade subunit CasD
MGVRVDRKGVMASDYHTAKDVIRADGSGRQPSVVSTRYYLADADFLVGLEGDRSLLEQIDRALASPVWPLYLGRKSFVPGSPVGLANGLRLDENLESALRTYPLTCRPGEQRQERLRLEIQVAYGEGDRVKQDQPLSFQERRFGLRHVRTDWVDLSALPVGEEEPCTFLS